MNINTESTVGDTSSSQSLTADQVKEWYNTTFCKEDDVAKEFEHVAITMSSEQGTIVLPVMQLNSFHTIKEIFQRLLTYLKNGGQLYYVKEPTAESAPEKEVSAIQKDKPVNFEQYIWRNKQYMVEHYLEGKEDLYKVIRVEDNKVLTEKHKTRSRMIKLFKEQYPVS